MTVFRFLLLTLLLAVTVGRTVAQRCLPGSLRRWQKCSQKCRIMFENAALSAATNAKPPSGIPLPAAFALFACRRLLRHALSLSLESFFLTNFVPEVKRHPIEMKPHLGHHAKLFFIGDEGIAARQTNGAELSDAGQSPHNGFIVRGLLRIKPQRTTSVFKALNLLKSAGDVP